MILAVTLTLCALLASPAGAQDRRGVSLYTSLPPKCLQNEGVIIPTGLSKGLYECSTADTWTLITDFSSGTSEGVPVGSILLIATGTCPTGYTEESALDGKTIIGTLAAHSNVGTTGGSDSVTPTFTGTAWSAPAISWPASVPTHSGTAASFTGTALGTHAHELPWQIPTTTTIRQIAVATFGTGTSRAATAVSAAGTANTTSAAVALSQAVSAGTPAGSVTITNQGSIAWPASVPSIASYTPVGTISAVDTRSAFIRVIACRKT